LPPVSDRGEAHAHQGRSPGFVDVAQPVLQGAEGLDDPRRALRGRVTEPSGEAQPFGRERARAHALGQRAGLGIEAALDRRIALRPPRPFVAHASTVRPRGSIRERPDVGCRRAAARLDARDA
jgi:hypothetical protein